MASLNKDELFWLNLHSTNTQLKEHGQPTRKMPNLGFLQKTPMGEKPMLERILHDRIIEFLIILKAPTTHKYRKELNTSDFSLIITKTYCPYLKTHTNTSWTNKISKMLGTNMWTNFVHHMRTKQQNASHQFTQHVRQKTPVSYAN